MSSGAEAGGIPAAPAATAVAAAKALVRARTLDYPRNFALYVVAVIGVFALVHWTSKAVALLRHPSDPGFEDAENGKIVSHQTSTRRGIPAAVVSTIRTIAFRYPIPVGLGRFLLGSEVACVVVYLVAVWGWTLADTNGVDPALFRNRAAHMAMVQLPFVIATAGKNNVLSFLTGISHEKLNILHRVSGRCSLVLLWVHALAHWAPGLPAVFAFSHGFMLAGLIGLVAFTLTTVLSVAPIRHYAFEFFLVSHIVCITAYLLGGWFHAVEFERKDAGENWLQWYFWPAVVLWALDRTLRSARLLRNNMVWRRGTDKCARGTVELLSEDTLRITLTRRMPAWTAGQHAYLLLPGVSMLPTEAHPFTIASAPHSLDGTPGSAEKELVFIVRTRGGFTRRLRERVRGGMSKATAFVDGPYGAPPDLSEYSTCVLFAGGSGVSYALSMLLNLVHLANAGKSHVQHIIFVWSVRDADHLDWISKSLADALAAAPSSLNIDLRLHVTGASAPTVALRLDKATPSRPSSSYDFWIEKARVSVTSLAFSEIVQTSAPVAPVLRGRPDIGAILREAMDGAAGPVSVDVCGPSALANDVRRALRFDLAGGMGVLKDRSPVTLHVETFGM